MIEQVLELAMDVSQNINGRNELEQNGLLLEDSLGLVDQQAYLLLFQDVRQVVQVVLFVLVDGVPRVLVEVHQPLNDVIQQFRSQLVCAVRVALLFVGVDVFFAELVGGVMRVRYLIFLHRVVLKILLVLVHF